MDTVPDRPAARPLQRRVAWVTIAWAVSEPLLLDGTADRWVALALGLLVTLPLLASRRAPIAAALLIAVTYLVQYALGLRMEGAMSPELALAMAMFGIAAYAPASTSRSAVALGLAAAVPLGLWVISLLDLGDISELAAMQYLYLSAVTFAGALPGIALRSRQREVADLEREVRRLYGQAADEIGAAVDGERRTLSHGIVRIVGGLVEEIHALVDRNRRALLGDRSVNGAFDGQTAAAARRAADELRGLLKNLTGRTDPPPGPATGAWATVRHPPPGAVRNALGLAVPVVALAVLGVVDRAELPPLPTSFPTTDGTLPVPASAVPAAVGYLLAILTPLGLLLRRRHPVAAVASVAAMLVLRALLDELSSLTISQVFVCGALAYNAGAWPRTRGAALLALTIALATTGLCWTLEQYRFDTLVYAYMVAVLLGTWLVGRAIRHDLRDALALRQRATVLRAQRERLCRAAVRGERREIAREMHDVVGHGLSLIAVQSGVVDVLAPRDAARALEALALVEDAAETTRGELEALRAALASPSGADDDARSCSRSLERIVADARGSGQPVVADVDPAVDALDPDHRTAVVRIAQEALTNARKHAGDAAVIVEVDVRPDVVSLCVRNQAGVPREDLPRGSQLGLRGMTERAESRGGRLDAGPDAGGGWTVRAELPRESADLVAG